MATYYYSNGRPEEEVGDAHSTLFQARPGVVVEKPRHTMKDVVVAVTPPILISAIKSLRK
jgi:hypothetical protein